MQGGFVGFSAGQGGLLYKMKCSAVPLQGIDTLSTPTQTSGDTIAEVTLPFSLFSLLRDTKIA